MTRTFDSKELVGAIAITTGGIALGGYAWMHYPMGSPAQMGPGFFPVALGVILVGIGLLLAMTAMRGSGSFPAVEWKSLVAVLLSGAFFALTVDRFGLVPAVVGLVIIVRAADKKYSVLGSIALASILAVIAVLIFRIGLSMPFAIVRGPG